MYFYKILQEVKEIKRFQLIQKAQDKLELRIVAEDREETFNNAKDKLQEFLNSKGISNVEITLSDKSPQANKTSGKFNHVYREVE